MYCRSIIFILLKHKNSFLFSMFPTPICDEHNIKTITNSHITYYLINTIMKILVWLDLQMYE